MFLKIVWSAEQIAQQAAMPLDGMLAGLAVGPPSAYAQPSPAVSAASMTSAAPPASLIGAANFCHATAR